MKAILLCSLFIAGLSCHNNKSDGNPIEVSNSASPDSSRHVVEKYAIGDIDNDREEDTATLSYDFSYKDDKIVDQKVINIKFSKKIPDLDISKSKGVFAHKIVDLNNDHANEMLIFSKCPDEDWNDMLVYSYKNGKWSKLATAKCFYSDFSDEINRIIKQKDKFYLLGDPPDASKDSLMKRTVMVEISATELVK